MVTVFVYDSLCFRRLQGIDVIESTTADLQTKFCRFAIVLHCVYTESGLNLPLHTDIFVSRWKC